MNIHSDKSNCLLYADDTSLFDIVENPNDSADKFNHDLEEMHSWAKTWLVTINPTNTFSAKRTKQQHPDLFYDGKKIHEVSHHTHLGVTLSSNLSWREHILNIYEKASKRLNVLKGIKYQVSRDTLRALYKSLVRPLMEYADVVWNGCSDTESDLLDSVQYEAGKIVTGAIKGISRQRLMCELGWEELKTRRAIHKLTLYFKIVNNLIPQYLRDFLPPRVSERTHFSVCHSHNFSIFLVRTVRFANSFFPSTIKLWNEALSVTESTDSIGTFKNALVSYLQLPKYFKPFDYSFDRYLSIVHTHIRLDACALNYHLHRIGIKQSPACSRGFINESKSHYFLYCPNYAAQRQTLLTSAACIAPNLWSRLSDRQKPNFLYLVHLY